PAAVRIEGLPEAREARVPLHPDFPDRGFRTIPGSEDVLLPKEDLEAHRGQEIRLKDWCNVHLEETVRFTSWEVKAIPKVQWLPGGLPTRVLMPDGEWLEGLGEESLSMLNLGTIVQFERFGFVRLQEIGREVLAIFAHR
ncbi:MAG: glutamate--tRNA ligase, partial [Thermoplasmata archaeon]